MTLVLDRRPALARDQARPRDVHADKPRAVEGPGSLRRGGRRDDAVDGLLVEIARGGQEAFAELHRRIAARLHGVVRGVTRDDQLSHDVLQEVFFEIWLRADRFDVSRGPGMPWLVQLAHSRAVDTIRRRESSRRWEQAFAESQAQWRAEAGAAGDPAATAVPRLPSAALQLAVAGLTAIQQQALYLVYVEGVTMLRASQRLGIALPTFKSRVFGAVAALRKVAHTLGPSS